MQKVEINGEEVEVYTAAERQADIDAAKAEVEGQYKPKLTAAEAETARLSGVLETRAKEFEGARGEFKRLSDEQVAKLDAKDRIIYDNQIALQSERETNATTQKKIHESAVETAIRAKVGGDTNLLAKVKEMYGLIQLEDLSPEQIQIRVNAAFGAVGVTTPDLMAAAGFGGGNFEPPTTDKETLSFADSPKGKEIARGLGVAVTEEEIKKEMGIV